MYTYSYVMVIKDQTYYNIIIQLRCGNIIITLLQAHYNQNAYLYIYAYIRRPKVFKSWPYTPTAISVHQYLISAFLPATLRNDCEIIISVNSEQDVPMFIVSH